jgi:DNA polymerase II small subunit/DNA polymerase delta subunit B
MVRGADQLRFVSFMLSSTKAYLVATSNTTSKKKNEQTMGLSSSSSGPIDVFGEFAEMVDVCMKMCDLMLKMFTDQIGVMLSIEDEIGKLASDIVTTSGDIIDMSEKIVDMEGKMVETEELMVEVFACIGNSTLV